MINETFVASDPKSAYELAVEKYGTNISLVSAKQIKYDDGVLRSEITVAIPLEVYEEVSLGGVVPKDDDEALLSEIFELKEQLNLMKDDMHKEIQDANPVVSEVKALFMRKGISGFWLESMFQTLIGSEVLEDAKLLAAYLLEEIDDALKVKEEDLTHPKVMMIVGPTGVGKTTTIAKLAARYAYLLDKRYKVALVNLDSFKVGAIEQLAHYADIMQIEHIVVDDVDNFKDTLERLEGYDVVLVDTAGMSPYDTEKFIQTVEFVKTDAPREIEVSLLLSATVKYEDMEDIYQNFSFLNPSSVIISKFDETKHFGTLLNFMLLYNLPMSYFATGQEVPDDLLLADKEFLLEQFIGDIDEG
ncbi:MAG TPA: flagellar biosynthesis protein FlhF [Epsilonproteobacteria bacterium]|nr:flagellar biosynthesis protein FlhF [Campylobacterota bacterium]